MSGVMEAGMDGKGEGSRSGAPDGRPEGGREVRWSARRKEGVVLRLLAQRRHPDDDQLVA